jgi:glycosyltransferase involved in cell wall biosynthesis
VRIAVIAPFLPSEFQGGTERVALAQARELARLGHSVRLVAATDSGGTPGQLQGEVLEGLLTVRVPRHEFERSPREHARPALAQRVVDAVGDVDLVHVHHHATFSSDLVRRLAERAPVVLTLHDHFVACPRSFCVPEHGATCPVDRELDACVGCLQPDAGGCAAGEVLLRLKGRRAAFEAELEAAREIYVPSRWLLESLKRRVRLNMSRVHVLPHGLCEELSLGGRDTVVREELATARAERRRKAPGHEGPLTILHFGNRARVKGCLELVRAAALLAEGSVRLIFCGREVEAGFDAELRRAAGRMALELHGAYRPEELVGFAAEADLAAFPSLAGESYGLVVDEAIALGLPALVSDAGALPERLASAGHGGRYPGRVLPAGDVGAWAACMRGLVAEERLLQDARAVLPDWLPTAAHTARELERRYTALSAVRERRAS